MSSAVVLDASAAVRLVVGPTPDLIASAVRETSQVLAPALFAVEVANALWKYVRAGVFSHDEASARLSTAVSLCDLLVPADGSAPDSILAEALSEASRLDHPVYDLMYLVTARRHGAALATCDRRLAALARSQGVRVVVPPPVTPSPPLAPAKWADTHPL